VPVSPLQGNDAILAQLEALFSGITSASIAEGRRIEFFEGKRKLKNGEWKRTGHHYWQYRWKASDTGKRKAKYGGGIETVPQAYQYRRRQYEASISDRSPIALADALFRPAIAGLQNGDTGKG
jgi:hypothetical protein